MNIVPKLNLNKHPRDVDDYSLVDATNMIIDNAFPLFKTEDGIYYATCKFDGNNNRKIVEAINEAISSETSAYNHHNIKYVLPCNKELVLFVEDNSNTDTKGFYIFRYNENNNEIKLISNNFEYNGGELIGIFTYNQNNLIIAISEYFEDNSKKIPLKILNLGTFEEGVSQDNIEQLNNPDLHPIIPKVKIPSVNAVYSRDIAYKGWYYIFIRYKHSVDNYTQWYNTNESIYIDSYNNEQILKTYISEDLLSNDNLGGASRSMTINVDISSNTDIANMSFKCVVNRLDNRYKYYQLGFVCVSKTYTKCFKTIDIDISTLNFSFSNKVVEEYSVNNIINTYYNYFNIKALTTVNNRLYIGNYLESNLEKNIKTSDIEVTLGTSFITIDEDSTINTLYDYYITNHIYLYDEQNKIKRLDYTVLAKIFEKVDRDVITECRYITATDFYIFNEGGRKGKSNYRESTIKKLDIKEDDELTIRYTNKDGNSVTKTILAKNFIYLFEPPYSRNIYGKYYFIENGVLIDDINDTLYTQRLYITQHNCNVYIGDKPLATSFSYSNTYTDSIEIEEQTAIFYYNTAGLMPNGYYNFFIHFVDEYGNITKGFNVNSNNFTNIFTHGFEQVYVEDGRTLFKVNNRETINGYYKGLFMINKLPEGFIGWFVSYEKFENNIIYKGVAKRTDSYTLEFYTDELNFSDVINLDFDSITVDNNKYYKIKSKKLYVADSYENILNSTKLKLILEEELIFKEEELILENYAKVYLVNTNIDTLYKKQIKTLIPCSDIFYDVNNQEELKVKTSFISTGHALIANNVFYNNALKVYQHVKETTPVSNPYTHITFTDYFTVPFESLQLNNKPVITFFPVKGLNETDESKKTFEVGNIIEVKNTIDLYQQKQVSVDELYPKSLDWYNPDIYFTDVFNKTIRRSNVIQDESLNIGWRQFEIEQYKNITENKGDIIKLISIGLYFLVHTEHSLFLFNSTDKLKSSNGNIQLDNTDIWDINYKEVLTSNLGYGGIQKEYSGITGTFGYIFYDRDTGYIFRYDDGKLERIDTDIQDFIKKLKGKNVHFVDDKQRNRLLISFVENKGQDYVLSYNYLHNVFVARHTYYFDRGYSTKNNTYLITKNILISNNLSKSFDIKILKFRNSNYGFYYNPNILNPNDTSNSIFPYPIINGSEISILVNTQYELIKFIEYIKYKVNAISIKSIGNEDYSPVEERSFYAGDTIRIISEFCDTENINVSVENMNEVNKITDYKKPYWRFGNWHINMIRNKIINVDLTTDSSTDDRESRVFGNWFVIKFKFNSGMQKEIETLDCRFSLDKN